MQKPMTWFLIPGFRSVSKFKVANNISNVIENSVKNWKVEITSGGETLGEVEIDRGKETLYHRSCVSSL